MSEPVVLVPGLQSDHRSWVWQLRHFSGRRRCIVPSGHYRDPSIDEMAETVFRQLPERFHLVAWSMGGYIMMPLLPRLGERLVSLVLVATSAGPDSEERIAARRLSVSQAEREGMRAAQRSSLAFSCADETLVETPEFQDILDASEAIGLDAYRSQQEAIIRRPDRREVLAAIACPTLVVVGQRDRVTPPPLARQIAETIAGARLHEIADCGHCPPLERPDLLNGLLETWFAAAETAAPIAATARR